MRILYDHQAFTIQDYGGISRYFFELTRQFNANPELTVIGSLLFSNNEFVKDNSIFQSISFFKSIRRFQKKVEFMNKLNELKSLSMFESKLFDVFHPTYYDPYYLNSKRKKPIVITFYDLIHEKFMKSNTQLLKNKKRVLTNADGIISVSESAKNDLMEYYNIPENKITVVHLASSISFSMPISQKEDTTDENYLLYIGNRDNYKNFTFFVNAISPLLIKEPDLFLYCAGGGKFTRAETEQFHKLKISRQIKWYSGCDESLTKMYSKALAFIFPSLYEGFGLPMVEAMSCGCPIGASQTSSLPEVSQDAALYFNPYDKDSILSVAETLVYKSDIRSRLKKKGLSRVQEFSWKKTASLTQAVYSSLV